MMSAKRGVCPVCGERVRRRAPKCDYCGHHLEGASGGGSGRGFAIRVGLAVLVLGAGALWARSAGWFGGQQVAGWPGAELVNGIVPGKMPLRVLAERVGTYDPIGTYGNNLEVVRYRPAGESVAELTVWLASDATIRWARVVPSGPVSPESMQASLRCVRNIVSITPGFRFSANANERGEMWSGGTGYLHVVDGLVKELWLIPAGVPHDEVLGVLRPRAPAPLDPAGMGTDLRRGE